MPKRWSLIVLLMAGASAASAQNAVPRIGVFGGVNLAKVAGNTLTDISNHVGGAFGLYYVAPVGTNWGLELGAIYTMKGWERKEPGTGDLAVVKLNYVEIPLLVRDYFETTGTAGVFVFAGPSVAFRAGCSIDFTDGGTGAKSGGACNAIGADFKSLDAAAILGAGFRFMAGRHRVVLTGQYEIGVMKIESGSDAKNRALTFGAGIELPFGH